MRPESASPEKPQGGSLKLCGLIWGNLNGGRRPLRICGVDSAWPNLDAVMPMLDRAAAAFGAARVLFEVLVALRFDWLDPLCFLACSALGCATYVGLAIVFGVVDLGRLHRTILNRKADNGR